MPLTDTAIRNAKLIVVCQGNRFSLAHSELD